METSNEEPRTLRLEPFSGDVGMRDKLAAIVRDVMLCEDVETEAALRRIVDALGIDAINSGRVRMVRGGGTFGEIFGVTEYPRTPGWIEDRGRALAVDGVEVWRGGWKSDGEYRATWSARWLTDLDRFVR